MKSTFSRIFSVMALIILVSVLGIGLSFRAMAQGFFNDEREQELKANAQAVSELAINYAMAASAGYTETGLAFHMNLTFASMVSGTDTLLCNAEGKVLTCSCQELGCVHMGMKLPEEYIQDGLKGVTGIGKLEGIYAAEEKRYYAAIPCTMSDGSVLGIVIVSQPVRSVDVLLNQISEMFVIVAFVMLIFAVVAVSFMTRNQCRPLRAMAAAAREFGHGNLKARVETGGDNTVEIDELALAFNNMANSLEKSEYQRQEFVANVSHELKTPMTTIGGYVDGILDGTIPPEKERQYLSLVSEEVKRLSRLVRSMLDVSRLHDQGIPVEKMTHFDVEECVGQVLISFEHKINEKKLDVQVEFPEYPVYARGQLDSITQVVYNLIDNAVKFCPEGGTLGLKIRESGNKLYVSVSNTGEPIPTEELPLVFDRFHKIDKSRSLNRDSWGLGLYIVKTIICSHGEDISVSSGNDTTEFTFTLTKVNSL